MAAVKEVLMTPLPLSFNVYAKEKVMFSKAQTGYEERTRYREWQMAFLIGETQGCVGLSRKKRKLEKRDYRNLLQLFS